MLQTQQLKRAHRLALSTVLLPREDASGLTTKRIRSAGSRPQILKKNIWLMPFLEVVPVDFPNNLSSVRKEKMEKEKKREERKMRKMEMGKV